MNRFLWLIDLYSEDRSFEMEATSAESEIDLSLWRQVTLYIGAVLGVLVGPFLDRIVKLDYPTFAEIFGSPMSIFLGLLFGFVVLVIVFKTKFIGAATPLFVQIGAAILVGLGSRTVIPLAIEKLGSMLFPS